MKEETPQPGSNQTATPSKAWQELEAADLRPPATLTISITGACNLACCHCWVTAGETSSPDHVTLKTLNNLLNDFAALGGTGIRITGGEPLCHPHWLETIQLARSLKFKTVILQTNAMLFNDQQIAALNGLDFPGLTIQVSLDGATAQAHDLVRGEGSHSSVLKILMKLVQAGLGQRISIFFTEMRHNLGEIPELLELVDTMGISSVTTGAMVQCGRAAETALIAPPEMVQYLGLLDRYDNDALFRELYLKIGTIAALEWRADTSIRQECCTFIENPYLTPSGRIYPCLLCHTDQFSVNGVFEKGLAAALVEGIPLWSALLCISRSRGDMISECQDCPGKEACAGGCLGRAWGSHGSLLAADDRCRARRAIYQQNGNISI